MKIDNIQSINLVRTNPAHFGTGKIQPVTEKTYGGDAIIQKVSGISSNNGGVSLQRTSATNGSKTFEAYLMEAVNSVNDNQMAVNKLQEQLITDPDSIDIHDVTIAVSKARMSMNLAQTVIDRLVTSWNEITTTR